MIFGDWDDPKRAGYDPDTDYPDVYTAQDEPCQKFLTDLIRLYQKHGLMLVTQNNCTESGNKQPMSIQSFDPRSPEFSDDLQDTLQSKLIWRHVDKDDPDLDWHNTQLESFNGFDYIFWTDLPQGITIDGYRSMNPDQVRMLEDELFKRSVILGKSQRPDTTTYPDCATANETATA